MRKWGTSLGRAGTVPIESSLTTNDKTTKCNSYLFHTSARSVRTRLTASSWVLTRCTTW